jgi:redox-sensitive bicupin YhaK (pirin superfamily)
LQQSNVETTINEKLVRTYKFSLNEHQSLNIPESSCAHLLVCISGEVKTSNKKLATGQYAFFNTNTKVAITNNQTNTANCVLLELK